MCLLKYIEKMTLCAYVKGGVKVVWFPSNNLLKAISQSMMYNTFLHFQKLGLGRHLSSFVI